MKQFTKIISEHIQILEGGASGHMKHIIDYDELTLDELKGIIYSLFGGRVEKMTEKIDGLNIQASLNDNDESIFIRNNGDLQSERGGMSIDDMMNKWSGRAVQQTFIESGQTLDTLLRTLGVKFFNPSSDTRLFLNCECLSSGTTNIIPYIESMVSVHDIWIYKKINEKWTHVDTTTDGLDVVKDAMENIDGAQITPEIIIQTTERSEKLRNQYFAILNRIFKKAHLKDRNTIDEYKQYMYEEWIREHADWIREDMIGFMGIYERYFHGVKSGNSSMRLLKNIYSYHLEELNRLESGEYKNMVSYVIEPLDTIFLKLGNDIIDLCQGFINDRDRSSVVSVLSDELSKTISDIQNDPNTTEATRTRLLNQIVRLNKLGNKINATEGVVFRYKGRLMKCTGSFAPLNQILGSLKYNR